MRETGMRAHRGEGDRDEGAQERKEGVRETWQGKSDIEV
jgi:hypothetical protein